MNNRRVDPNDPTPRYFRLYTSLIERIETGEFPPGSAMPTERQLTEEYGVSRITVVKSLDMLERDGYVERQQGRGTFATDPATRRQPASPHVAMPTVAFVSFSMAHPYLSAMLAGAAAGCARHKHPLQVFGFVDSTEEEAEAIGTALERGAQGLIIVPARGYRNATLYGDLLERGVSLVLLDRYYPEVPTDYVVFDDRRAGYDLTSYLLNRGHRRIAVVPSIELKPTSVRDRLAGYRQAIEGHGLRYDEDLFWIDMADVFDWNLPTDVAAAALRTQLARHLDADRPSALLAINYDVAEMLIYALHALNAGPAARAYNPVIVSPSHKRPTPNMSFMAAMALQPGEQLGQAAMDLLHARLAGSAPAQPQHVVLPMEMMILDAGCGPAGPSVASGDD